MSSAEEVTHWLRRLQAGDGAAAGPLWEHYFRGLVLQARRRLRGAPRAAADEEDVALSAFDSFCRGAQQGRFTDLVDRKNLWSLLFKITARKALKLRRHEQAAKRGGGRVRAATDLAAGPDEGGPLTEVVGREPTPEFTAGLLDEYRRLLDLLPEPELRVIAARKLEGYSSAEIARQLGVAGRTVDRKLG